MVTKAFLIPLVMAGFALILVRALDRLWHHIPGVGPRLPAPLTTVVSSLVIVAIGLSVAQLIVDNVAGVQRAAPTYQARFTVLKDEIEDELGDLVHTIRNLLPSADEPADGPPGAEASAEPIEENPNLVDFFIGKVDVRALAANLGAGLLGGAMNVLLVLIYLFFLLLERPFFDEKLRAMVRDDDRRGEIKALLERIDHDVSVYLGLKTIVSLMTALPSYAVMRAVGLDFAEFWAIVIFGLNFIPNVGSAIATILPAAIALLQFETLGPFWTIAIGITAIQLFVANVIEPSLLGRRLNISPLVVILALVGWSLLWGIPGAFLCVPMTNILILVFANIRSTRWLAVLLSRDGDLAAEVEA